MLPTAFRRLFAPTRTAARRWSLSMALRVERLEERDVPSLSPVANTTAAPYSAVVHIEARFPLTPANTFWNGSGTVIDRTHVLTAGHVLYNAAEGGWATEIWVSAGQNGASKPFGTIDIVNPQLRAFSPFLTDAGSAGSSGQHPVGDGDIGLITLNQALGDATGTISIGYNNNDVAFSNQLLTHTGYPAESPYTGQTMYTETGSIIGAVRGSSTGYGALQWSTASLSAIGGESGSGLFYTLPSGQEVLYGVHDVAGGGFGYAERITQGVYNQLQSWIQQDAPTAPPVQSATSVQLTASYSAAVQGQPVVFTAAVSAAAGQPAGAVLFYDGSALIGSTLARGAGPNGAQATFRTAGLWLGTHGITAVYQGNASFLGGTSNALTETITPVWINPRSHLFAVGTGPGTGSQVGVYNADGSVRFALSPYPGFAGGVQVAVGDVFGTGTDDLVTVPNVGGGPEVHVYDGVTGALVSVFNAYDPRFTGGVQIALGDTRGPGPANIVTVPGRGGSPEVRVFTAAGLLLQDFNAYDPGFTGGIQVAVADTTGLGYANIITVPGRGGSPEVRVFDGRTPVITGTGLGVPTRGDFNAYDVRFTGGITVAAGDTTGSGHADIITAPGRGGTPEVHVYDGPSLGLRSAYNAYDVAFTGGIALSAADALGRGYADVVTVPGPGGTSEVRAFDGRRPTVQPNGGGVADFAYNAYSTTYTGGAALVARDVPALGHALIATVTCPGCAANVRFYDPVGQYLLADFIAFDPGYAGGVTLA